MSDLKAQINDLMIKSSQSTALTAEALKQFTALQEQAEKLQNDNKELAKQLENSRANHQTTIEQAEGLRDEVISLRKQVADLLKWEKQAERDAFEKTFHVTRGNEFKELLYAVFRNATVNKIMSGSAVANGTISANPNYYPSSEDKSRAVPVHETTSETQT